MRTFIPGTDRGSVVLTALILIILLSSAFIAFVSRVNAMERFAAKQKVLLMREIEQSNMELADRHELH